LVRPTTDPLGRGAHRGVHASTFAAVVASQAAGSRRGSPRRDTPRAMSEEFTTPDPVESLRQGFEAMSRGDLDAVMRLYAPDAVYDLSDAGLETLEGEEAIRRFLEDWHRSWEDYRFEEEEILDLGHGVWLGVVRESARLVGGKGRVETRVAQVSIWANGKVEWVKAYRDPDEARAAAKRLAEERE
jgi:ketosteroid isomerase-like protein